MVPIRSAEPSAQARYFTIEYGFRRGRWFHLWECIGAGWGRL